MFDIRVGSIPFKRGALQVGPPLIAKVINNRLARNNLSKTNTLADFFPNISDSK
jgi:hypothetical protein